MILKYKNMITTFLVAILINAASIWILLTFLKVVGTPDEWETHNYYYSLINKSILSNDDHIEVVGDSIIFRTSRVNSINNYLEEIEFKTTANSALIGEKTSANPHLFGGTNNILVTFTIKEINIYKLEFSNVYISSSKQDPNPNLVDDIATKKIDSHSYSFKLTSDTDIYLYSFGLTYLVHK